MLVLEERTSLENVRGVMSGTDFCDLYYVPEIQATVHGGNLKMAEGAKRTELPRDVSG
jgi:hypothetical protein